MPTVCTYGSLTIDSSELIDIQYSQDFDITSIPTISLTEITQPGNLRSIEINITARFDNDARIKFDLWRLKLAEKSLDNLTIFTTNLGEFYLTSFSASVNELDDLGDILRFDSQISFKQNINFG
jgi:hypothetical protein